MVITSERCSVISLRVSKYAFEHSRALNVFTYQRPIIMTRLVAKVSNQCSIWLEHLALHRRTSRVISFQDVERYYTVTKTRGDERS